MCYRLVFLSSLYALQCPLDFDFSCFFLLEYECRITPTTIPKKPIAIAVITNVMQIDIAIGVPISDSVSLVEGPAVCTPWHGVPMSVWKLRRGHCRLLFCYCYISCTVI